MTDAVEDFYGSFVDDVENNYFNETAMVEVISKVPPVYASRTDLSFDVWVPLLYWDDEDE